MTACFQEPQRRGPSQPPGQEPAESAVGRRRGSPGMRVGARCRAFGTRGRGMRSDRRAAGGLRGTAGDCGGLRGTAVPAGSTPSRFFRRCPGWGRPGAETQQLRLLEFGLWVSETIGIFKVGGVLGVDEEDACSAFHVLPHHCSQTTSSRSRSVASQGVCSPARPQFTANAKWSRSIICFSPLLREILFYINFLKDN